jgi:hypothetical protein
MAEQSQMAEGAIARARSAGEHMPRRLRRLLLALLGLLLAGASYLLSVRGEALILDLAAVSQRIFCF